MPKDTPEDGATGEQADDTPDLRHAETVALDRETVVLNALVRARGATVEELRTFRTGTDLDLGCRPAVR